jgi:hypothetical protein
MKNLQDLLDMGFVLDLGLGVDENVIQVDLDKHIDELLQDLCHHPLERGQCIY